jgi:ribosomal protein S2
MQKCFKGIMTHDILDNLILLNANKNSMAILEADQLQIPIIS